MQLVAHFDPMCFQSKITDFHLLVINELENVEEHGFNKLILDFLGKLLIAGASIELSLLSSATFVKYLTECFKTQGAACNSALWVLGIICASQQDEIRVKITQLVPAI